MATSPIEERLQDRTELKSRERLYRSWDKALRRLDEDPDGAVTAARSFLESVCKHALDALGVPYGPNLDLMQQFRLVAGELKLTATGETGRIERQFYSGTNQIVQSLAELRNQTGDAHGKGHQGVKASLAQAELAVNLSGATGIFLLRKLDSHLAATRRLNSAGNAVLRFDKATVWRLVDHAQNSPDHLKSFRQRKPKPAIWLVADAGIYLMSNGKPALLHTGVLAEEDKVAGELRLVAHADGCGPLDDIDDWMPLQEAMSGGDDFVESLRLKDIRVALDASDRQIVIVSSDSHYRIYSDLEFDELANEASLDL
ncbi:MAG: abortive infection family protein [Brevundimonas aurantiaca]|uniref:abortive infection family protein n=1 Tax=Brevundimonas aurantiaca TaxID=74316 RepID=UPI00391A557B